MSISPTAIRRVTLPESDPEPERADGIKCRLCASANPRGRRRCLACNADLQPPKPRPSTLSQFTDTVARGEDMPVVSHYLHRHEYLEDLTPDQFHALRRKRGRRAAEQRDKRLRQRGTRRERYAD